MAKWTIGRKLLGRYDTGEVYLSNKTAFGYGDRTQDSTYTRFKPNH